MNYSVSELGGFAGQVLSEGTGRAAIGRQKDEEARKKAEAEKKKAEEAAKKNGDTGQSGEGFINALGAGLIRIKNDLKDLWDGLKGIGESVGNLVGGKGFNTDAELEQMEINKQIAVAAAMGEYSKTKSKDMADQILADFNKDSREVTDAKRQVMVDANLDTTELDRELAIRRKQDAAYKAELANQGIGKETYGYANGTPNDVGNGKLDQKFEKYFPGGTYPYYVTGDHDQELYREMFKNGDFPALDSMESSYLDSIKYGRPKGKNVKITKETEDFIIEQHNQDRIAAFGGTGIDENGNVMPGWMPGLIKDKEALIRSNPGEGNPERFKHWHIVKNEGKETWDFHHDPYDATDGYSGLLGHALYDNLKVFIEKKVKKIIKK